HNGVNRLAAHVGRDTEGRYETGGREQKVLHDPVDYAHITADLILRFSVQKPTGEQEDQNHRRENPDHLSANGFLEAEAGQRPDAPPPQPHDVRGKRDQESSQGAAAAHQVTDGSDTVNHSAAWLTLTLRSLLRFLGLSKARKSHACTISQ